MNDKRLLQVCAVLLLGILIILAVQNLQPKNESLGDKVNEFVEEVKDEIDDHTTTR